MDSGIAGGEDESYNVYDKPWRQDKDIAAAIYKPSKNIEKDVYGDDLDKLVGTRRYDLNFDLYSLLFYTLCFFNNKFLPSLPYFVIYY